MFIYIFLGWALNILSVLKEMGSLCRGIKTRGICSVFLVLLKGLPVVFCDLVLSDTCVNIIKIIQPSGN